MCACVCYVCAGWGQTSGKIHPGCTVCPLQPHFVRVVALSGPSTQRPRRTRASQHHRPKPDGRTDVETPAQDRPNHSAPEPESGERLALWRPIRLGSLGSTRLPLARGSAPQPRLLLCEMGRTASPALQVSFPPPSRATPLSVVRRIFENASHRPRAMLRSHRPREPSSARAK